MRTISISGFQKDGTPMGVAYEDMCQRMLWRGVAYLAEVKPPLEMWENARSLSGIYGLVMTEGDDLKGLEAAIIKPGDDVTGAMHHAVMSHLCYIHEHGSEAWLAEAAKHRPPEDFFEWTGAL